MKLLLC